MSDKLRPHYADQKGVVANGFDGNGIITEGSTPPVDGTSGFAPGCLFFRRAGTAGARLYRNEGSATSCAFKPFSGARTMSGMIALDGSNPTPVATGLTTITSAIACLQRTTSLATGTAFVTVDFTGSDGTLNLYGWVVAGTASTGTENVCWFALGT